MDSNTALPSDLNILDRLALLPIELQCEVLFHFLTESSPCAMSLFVPDWDVCTHAADPVNDIYDLQRIDVYTRGAGVVRGKFEARVKHDDDAGGHVVFPLAKQTMPNGYGGLMGELGRMFPDAMGRALRDLERHGLHCFQQLWPRGPDDEIGKCMAGGGLVFREQRGGTTGDLDAGPTTVGAAMPPLRHLMFNGFPRDPWRDLRLRRNALTRSQLEMRLLVERGPDLLAVTWGAMTQLETLYLDLRAYGRGQVGEDSVRLGARAMACLRLGSLVIAGLRSGERYARPAGWQLYDWETDEAEAGGGVNWVKVFCGAVREGGRLVFVDRRMLDISWEGWRMRAEKEGLLSPEAEETVVTGESENAAYMRHVVKVLT
ncbi:hypothetical protein CGRA01v4_10389 [Colletotrichum graminicola]|uniref:Uncharacterized protein n=1 Tax=Colletotrichum graminicola (strain M1.001 / M2 / FGSC 10212) TaxID=645133 RepID=E3QDE8_COLGM|nr:uncharacterized protein GLRG_04064 [Colletotrichum graminicola M1.001]EFQ28920.1 hypothetical protein GLRG_04064 [Colletotrichum graminicola M1.001]WDK19102.1 hypothetical protein CGRA01v4_10389 [Colletotrichum graminicola]